MSAVLYTLNELLQGRMKEGKFLDIQKVYDNIHSVRLDILSFYISSVLRITYPGGSSIICLPGGTLP